MLKLATGCNRHGAQGVYDEASKQTLENEFGSHNEDECMIKILEGGTLQETEVTIHLTPARKNGYRLTVCVCRRDSVKGQRTIAWVLARVIRSISTAWEIGGKMHML